MRIAAATVPSEPSTETLRLLREAITEIRSYPNDVIMSSRFERAHDVADYLERLINALMAGDSAAGRELYMVFNATGSWDDAGGSHELGNQLCEALRPYYPGTTASQ